MINDNEFTIDDFRAMINELVDDASDPNGELYMILNEGREHIEQAAKFDMEFAKKLGLIVSSIESLVDYAKSRRELH